MKKFLCSSLLIIISTLFLFTVGVSAADEVSSTETSITIYDEVTQSTTEAVTEETTESESTTEQGGSEPDIPAVPTDLSPIVSLEGKTVFIVGNSHLYYGNCVIYGSNGKNDQGYLQQIIKAFGENTNVIDHTYSGKTLDYIYENYLSKISPEILSEVDYVVLSEAGKQNEKLLEHCRKIMALFPESTEFFFSCHPIIYDWDLDTLYNSLNALREEGLKIINWGKMIYDVYTGTVTVPGGVMSYNRLSFIKDNIRYDEETDITTGDDKHPNPLAGYISAQAIYTALTNRTALFTDYNFCNDKSINKAFDFDSFIAKHYNAGKPTNFDKIFDSPQDMTGLQKLIDIYNEAEGRHAVITAQGIAASCYTSGTTTGYSCSLCDEVFKKQELIDPIGEHTPVYTAGTAPSCKRQGKTAETHCSTCSQVLVKAKVLPALGHSYTEEIIDDDHLISPANYSSPAVYKYDCSRCDSSSKYYTFTNGSKRLLGTPKDFSATAAMKSVTLSWSKVKNADGYRIKRYDSSTGSWVKVANTNKRAITVDGLSAGKKYKFSVTAYINQGGEKVFSDSYTEIGTATKPKNVKAVSAKRTTTAIKLSWEKSKGATGYIVYRYTNGTWKKIANVTETSYRVTGLSAGKTYKFSIRPYIKTASGIVKSPSGTKYTTATRPSTPKVKVISSPSKGTAKITWNDLKNETGYQVYYSTSLSGSYKKYSNYKANITAAGIKKLKSSKNYYIKIRAYKTTDTGNIYSVFSTPQKIKIK